MEAQQDGKEPKSGGTCAQFRF